jgi:hypothetical protein
MAPFCCPFIVVVVAFVQEYKNTVVSLLQLICLLIHVRFLPFKDTLDNR